MTDISILDVVSILSVILLSMTLHEVMHGFVAYWLGDDTAKLQGRLTLNPVKHIDPFLTILLPIILYVSGAPIFGGAKPVPFNPSNVRYGEWGAALVAIAGPLTNLFIAFVCYGISIVSSGALSSLSYGDVIGTILAYGVMINLGFFVFNIIPIPPLDGSRVLYALAPEFVRRGMEILEQYGLIVVGVLVIFGGSIIGSIMSTAIQAILTLFDKIFVL